MASAEGRARWLHYANHCIIQEDYKGSSSKSLSEESRGHGAKSYDFLADTKWWLHPQPKDTATCFWEPSWETVNIEEFSKIKELEEAVIDDTSQNDHHLLISEKPEKLFSEMESQLIRIHKTEPWWRTAELDSFEINKPVERFVPDKELASLDQRSPTSVGISQSQSCEVLEALCHSQRRARQAEEAAKKAYDEKEDMMRQFRKQASELFAYKQWFRILQLETSLRNSNFVPIKGKKQKKGGCKSKSKRKPRYKRGKSFGSILLGLSLAGTGLLLGWTLGWLFR